MKKTRRKFAATFKAKVAIDALKERETLSELSKKYDVHANMISKWKQEFIDRSSEIFETDTTHKTDEEEQEKLYAKIGQLEMERDFLKKTLKRAGM